MHAKLIADGQHFSRVIRDGVATAEVGVDLATADFKAMRVPVSQRGGAVSVVELLRRLAERGVEVRILHAGVPSGPALEALRGLPAGLTVRRCPRVHLKTVIIDCKRMYVGSANLTGAGLGAKSDGRRNFELGVWTCDTTLIDGVVGYFNAIWEGRRCGNCGRTAVCPAPLEEPHLDG